MALLFREITMETLLKTIGDRIRELRQERSLLQRELAERAGLPVRTIGRIERGDVDVRLGTLKKIADALNLTMHDLL